MYKKKGHFRPLKTYEQQNYYYPNLQAVALKGFQGCRNCLFRKSPGITSSGEYHPSQLPLQVVLMDYLTVEESLQGYKYLLVMVGHFMKLALAIPTRYQQRKQWLLCGKTLFSCMSSLVALRPRGLF